MAKNWAICIGINQYDDLQPLNFAVRDAERMKDWLIDKAGFPESQVYYFADNAPPITDASVTFEAKPTFATLIRFLNRRFNKPFLQPGDNLWFFFSGHGSRYQERDYLMFADSSADYTLIERTAISTNFIVERLRKSGADNVMLFIDACREGDKSGRGIELEKEQGIITIASCSPNEFSYEIDELQHGSFTYALLESLDFQGENNCATVERLNRRLRERVKQVNSFYKKPRQTPRAVIEPASKYHLILLPEYIRPTDQDIAVLKIDAFKAERAKNWVLAEALWTRLIRFDQEEALNSLKQIWEKSQSQGIDKEVNIEPVSDKSGEKSILERFRRLLRQQGTEREVEPEIISNQLEEKPIDKNSSGLSSFEFVVVTLNEQGKETKRETKQAEYYFEDLGNDITLDMVSIPGGSFIMGSPTEELQSLDIERPQHKVNVANFFMGRYPITQAQWKEVASWEQVERALDPDPSSFKENYPGIDRWTRPVEKVSWEDAKEFCKRLSNRTNKEYRLPTEAEWEYACRANTTTPFHFGQTISTKFANYDGNYTYAKGSKGIYIKQTIPVGYFKVANNFGLCDMHGNIWEWCEDDWKVNYQKAPTDGKAWLSGKSNIKVIRGGSWNNNPNNCRSASRNIINPEFANVNSIGFRIMCEVPRIV